MARGLKGAGSWRRVLWARVAPGRMGGSAFGLLPLLFFLPLEAVPVFGEQLRGVAILIWLFSLSLALAIRGGAGLRDEASIWAYQKGVSLGRMALDDWILDLGLFSVVSIWWASLGVLAAGQTGTPPVSLWVAFFTLGFCTAALTHSLTLCLSAVGVQRPSDLTILFAILSLAAPVLALRAPDWVLELVSLSLPPFRSVLELHGALRAGDPGGLTAPLLHLLVFSGFVLWWGLRQISAWRPRG